MTLPDYLRAIILGFNVGGMVWFVVVLSILYANFKETRSRKTKAIFLLFVGWGLDVLSALLLSALRLTDQYEMFIEFTLVLRIVFWIITAIVITNFMYVMYGDFIKGKIQRWLDARSVE